MTPYSGDRLIVDEAMYSIPGSRLRELREAESERDAHADALRAISQYATMCDASGGLPSSVRLREIVGAALDRHTHQDKAVT